MWPKLVGVALIVEDDPQLSAACTVACKKLGFDAIPVYDVRSAMRALETHRPTFVSIDLELPDESGYELCDHIRVALGLTSVPILVTSSRASLEEMAHAEEAGANAFLEKPFTMNRFCGYVAALCDAGPASSPDVLRLRL